MNLKPYIYSYSKNENNFYIQRDDLIPYSFGGNKVRKNIYYFEEIISKNYTHVVTYGSSSSNHARIVANLAIQNNLKCTIITPLTEGDMTYNSTINNILQSKIVYTPLDKVKETIDGTLEELKAIGEEPYFIQGGGHGFLGTKAYVDSFKYINDFSSQHHIKFDYIFLASGTGATQAGLIIGNHLEKYESKIVGISIARNTSRGIEVIKSSMEEYFKTKYIDRNLEINFKDKYLCGGYGKFGNEISNCIDEYMQLYGIPLDPTYTGKAVYGMHEYLKEHEITNRNILFIHTGGLPLYFDYLKEKSDA